MSKKILSVMLALVMVMSVFSVVSFAAVHVEYEQGEIIDKETGERAEIEQTQYWSLETDNVADANGKYTVNVVLETNYAVGATSFAIVAEGATLESAVEGAALVAADGFNADVRLDKAKNIVYIVPDPAEEGTEAPVLASGSVIATLTFALTADTATVALMNDAKLADNAGTLIAARPADGLLSCNTIIYGQRVIDADGNDIALGDEIASVTLGEEVVADPELIGKAGTTGYVDKERGFVYGVDADADPHDYFEATNEGYFEMTASVNPEGKATAENGTGAILTLYNKSGEVVTTYTLVIFGDINGDATIAPGDALFIYNHSSTAITLTGAFFFAADIKPDDAVAPGDALLIYNHASTADPLPPNVWAA